MKDVYSLAQLCVRLEDFPNGGFIVHNKSELYLVVEVKSKQNLDPLLMVLRKLGRIKFNEPFSQRVNGVLRYQGRLCVTDVNDFRGMILEEVHGS